VTYRHKHFPSIIKKKVGVPWRQRLRADRIGLCSLPRVFSVLVFVSCVRSRLIRAFFRGWKDGSLLRISANFKFSRSTDRICICHSRNGGSCLLGIWLPNERFGIPYCIVILLLLFSTHNFEALILFCAFC